MKASAAEKRSVEQLDVIRFVDGEMSGFSDHIAVEEPLEIRVSYGGFDQRVVKSISVTMRTPGNDAELATGFLFTEGLVFSSGCIKSVEHSEKMCSRNAGNEVTVGLTEGFIPQVMNAERNFYTTSSCGVCGKASIQSIRTVSTFQDQERKVFKVSPEMLCQLPDRLWCGQRNFTATGGIHASGVFDAQGNLVALREDVGRHNALDKVIGYALLAGLLPMDDKILVLSGRASFELIQKAVMAGITFVAAIGAPSSLAVEMAREFDVTLIGFLKKDKFNIYHKSGHHEIA